MCACLKATPCKCKECGFESIFVLYICPDGLQCDIKVHIHLIFNSFWIKLWAIWQHDRGLTASFASLTPSGQLGSMHKRLCRGTIFFPSTTPSEWPGSMCNGMKLRNNILARNNTEHWMVTLALFYLLCPSHAICPMFWSCQWGTTEIICTVSIVLPSLKILALLYSERISCFWKCVEHFAANCYIACREYRQYATIFFSLNQCILYELMMIQTSPQAFNKQTNNQQEVNL